MEVTTELKGRELHRVFLHGLVELLYARVMSDFETFEDPRPETEVIASRDDAWLLRNLRELLREAQESRERER